MSFEISTTMIVFAAVFFFAGVGWGQWWEARKIRLENENSVKGRLFVSVPTSPDDAAAVMKLLADLMKKVRDDR